MATTFNGVTLAGAGKAQYSFPTHTNSTTLMSGKNYVQSSAQYGVKVTFECFGTWAEFEAILALVGSKYTLVTEHDTWTNMYIEGEPNVTESDAPGYFKFKVSFVRHTV